MTAKEAAKLISENAMYMALMEENIQEGVMIEESRACADALHAEVIEAKRVLAKNAIFSA